MATSRIFRIVATLWCAAAGFLGAIPAEASVVIAGTRVIYNAGEAEATVRLSSEGKTPALVQAWIDNGDMSAAPSAIDVPFIVTPPISRIDPGKGQVLRIAYTGEPLPQGTESVFWLNVLEVPPKPTPDEAGANKMQLAFRTRIKMFFRPHGLKGTAEGAPAQIIWHLTRVGGQPAVEAHNPSAYHVSFTSLDVRSGSKDATFDDGGMVAPGESKVFPLKGDVSSAGSAKVHYTALNDYGGPLVGDATIQQDSGQPLK